MEVSLDFSQACITNKPVKGITSDRRGFPWKPKEIRQAPMDTSPTRTPQTRPPLTCLATLDNSRLNKTASRKETISPSKSLIFKQINGIFLYL
jgi:hypothetical protein